MTIAAPPEQLSDAARSFLQNAHHDLLIGGERPGAADGRTFETLDPATGEPIAVVAHAGAEDVDRAVRAARAAFEDGPWATMPAADRGALIERLAELVEENADELAELESLDNGKPVTIAQGRRRRLVGRPPALLRGLADEDRGRGDPGPRPEHALLHAQGAGGRVRADHPVELPAADGVRGRSRPALAAGCTIVLKPAEQTPLTALRLGELALEAGIPEGVLNVITGDGETGAALVDHPGVDKIAFTGSTAVGREIGAKAGPRAQARDARAGRQVAQHHPARRRPRRRHQGLVPGDLLQHRPGLQRRLAAVRAPRTSSTRSSARWPLAPPRRRSARAWTRTRSSARSSRPSSSSA